MMDDMNDIEKLLWIEKRFGITKTLEEKHPSNDKVEALEQELNSILSRYREEYKITMPMPRIRMWLTDNKMNFLFFDRKSGKRILLGNWLSNKEDFYER
jgi:hypothetical protein